MKDAVIMSTLSRLCKEQTELMSANAIQFKHQEIIHKLKSCERLMYVSSTSFSYIKSVFFNGMI